MLEACSAPEQQHSRAASCASHASAIVAQIMSASVVPPCSVVNGLHQGSGSRGDDYHATTYLMSLFSRASFCVSLTFSLLCFLGPIFHGCRPCQPAKALAVRCEVD